MIFNSVSQLNIYYSIFVYVGMRKYANMQSYCGRPVLPTGKCTHDKMAPKMYERKIDKSIRIAGHCCCFTRPKQNIYIPVTFALFKFFCAVAYELDFSFF